MSSERNRPQLAEFSVPAAPEVEPSMLSGEDVIEVPTLEIKPETKTEKPPRRERQEKSATGKSSVLELISTVSQADLSKYANLLAKKVETIPEKDCVNLLVQLMQRFMTEEANEAAVERKAGGRTGLTAGFEEFQSSQDMEKQTQRYMVEMLVDEWVRSTGRRLVDPESSRQVNEAIRTIREDMKVGWFKRVFRGKLSETEIIKATETLQFDLDEMREKLKKAKLQESQIVRDSNVMVDQAQAEAKQIKDAAGEKAEQLVSEAKQEARGIIKEARQESEKLEASAEKKVQTAEERIKSANLEEERLRVIIAELKSNPDVAKVYEAKFNKEESLKKFKRNILSLESLSEFTFGLGDYVEKLQNILNDFSDLTTEETSGLLLDIWLEKGGTMRSLPSQLKFWSAVKQFLPKFESGESEKKENKKRP